MHIRIKPMAAVFAFTFAWLMATGAQSASSGFFGGSGSASTAVPQATPARPSPSQVWSNDDFTKKTAALKSQNDAQYQQNFNAKLKPMPSQTTTSTARLPVPAGSPAPTATPAPAPSAAPASTTAPAATSNGYTGFVSPNNSNTNTTTPAKSGGWGVTY